MWFRLGFRTAMPMASVCMVTAAGLSFLFAADVPSRIPPPDISSSGGIRVSPAPGGAESDDLDASAANEARAAIERGVAWLIRSQHGDGHWSDSPAPGLTALPLWAVAGAGGQEDAVAKALAWLLARQSADGSFRETPVAGVDPYRSRIWNTAVSLLALRAAWKPELTAPVLKARDYLRGRQCLAPGPARGGFGPEGTRAASNAAAWVDSYYAFEAMYLSAAVESLRPQGRPRADLDWKAAIEFLARDGIRPPEDSPGTTAATSNSPPFRLDSRAAAALLGLRYAGAARDDARVKLAAGRLTAGWSLEPNPERGSAGGYEEYAVLAKAVMMSGKNEDPAPESSRWQPRTDLVAKLTGLQRIDPGTGDGYWMSREGAMGMSNALPATAHAILALLVAAGM